MKRKDILAMCRRYLPKPYYNYNKIIEQLQEYTEGLGLTFDQIGATLKYWYEVEKSDPSRSGGGIGIVPHVYKDALDYWEKEKRMAEVLSKFKENQEKPEEIVLQARPPYIEKPKTMKLFELK